MQPLSSSCSKLDPHHDIPSRKSPLYLPQLFIVLFQPADELQRSYEQFLHHLKLLKEQRTKKRIISGGRSNNISPQEEETTLTENGRAEKGEASHIYLPGDQHESVNTMNSEGACGGTRSSSNPSEASSKLLENLSKDDPGSKTANHLCEDQGNSSKHEDKMTARFGEDTIVVKFVGSAIIGKSEAEDAWHHGLVDLTVNTKEAMNAISNMFKEPLELELMVRRRSNQSKSKEIQQSNKLEVFVDEAMEEELQPEFQPINQNPPKKQTETNSQKPFVGTFKTWTEDDDDDNEDDKDDDGKCTAGHHKQLKEQIEVPEQHIL